jgi:hypothetical protein
VGGKGDTVFINASARFSTERIFSPSQGYVRQEQGEWDTSLETYALKHAIRLKEIVREEMRQESVLFGKITIVPPVKPCQQ